MSDYEPNTIVRHAALSLRDYVETVDADQATVELDGLKITYSASSNAVHLFDGTDLTDITEWVDQVWMVPA